VRRCFNADGSADLLWQKTDGTPPIWIMNNTSVASSSNLAKSGSTWHVPTMTA